MKAVISGCEAGGKSLQAERPVGAEQESGDLRVD